MSWTHVICDPNGEKIVGTFYEKELQKESQEKIKIEKVIKRKLKDSMPNGKALLIPSISV